MREKYSKLKREKKKRKYQLEEGEMDERKGGRWSGTRKVRKKAKEARMGKLQTEN
jgi:hypothetical protein